MSDDKQKLLELLDKHGASLHALLTRLTLSEDAAEELMQELFVKLNGVKDFSSLENACAYASKAATNLAFDWWRRQKRGRLPLDAIAEPVSDAGSPLTDLVEREQLQEVLRAVSRLKNPSRDVVVMRYMQGGSYDFIAGRLGKTEHQVRAMCSKALRKLQRVLNDKDRPRYFGKGA